MEINQNSEQMISDLQIIDERINEGDKRIGNEKSEKGFFILGKTGAGKTTLAYFLNSIPLISKKKTKREYILEPKDLIDGQIEKISHGYASKTTIPEKFRCGGITVWDCPGFFDTEGIVQELPNAFYIQRLFTTTKNSKFVLVISYLSFANRAGEAVDIVTQFSKLFKDHRMLAECVCLVVSQAPSDYEEDETREIIDKIIKENKSLMESTKDVFTYLLNSIEIFHAPSEENLIVLDGGTLLNKIDQSTKYIQNCTANITLPKNCINFANDLFETSHKILFDSLNQIANKIIERCENYHKKSNLNYPLNLQDNSKDLLKLKEMYIFNDFSKKILEINNSKELLNLLEIGINDLISILSRGLIDSETQKLQRIIENISKNSRYVEFLELVSESKKTDIQKFTSMIKRCDETIEKAYTLEINSLKLDSTKNEKDYYIEAIEYLTKFRGHPRTNQLFIEAHFNLARINSQNKNYSELMKNLIILLEIDPNYQKAYTFFENIFMEDSNLLNELKKYSRIADNLYKKLEVEIKTEIYEKVLAEIAEVIGVRDFLTYTSLDPFQTTVYRLRDLANLDTSLQKLLNIKDNNLNLYSKILLEILESLGSNSIQSLHALRVTCESKLKYFAHVQNLFSQNYNIDIFSWLKIKDKVSNTLYERIKKVMITNKENDLTYYNLLKELLNLPLVVSTKKSLKTERQVIQNLSEIFYLTGKIHFSNKNYESAQQDYEISYTHQPSKSEVLDSIDKIFDDCNKVKINNDSLLMHLFERQDKILIDLFKTHSKFMFEYKNKSKVFIYSNAKGFDEMTYFDHFIKLEELHSELLDSFQLTSISKCLGSIYTILISDVKDINIARFKEQFKDIKSKINYIECLFDQIAKNDPSRDIKSEINNWFKPIHKLELKKSLIDQIQRLTVPNSLQNEIFYQRILNITLPFKTDENCKSIIANTYYCLGFLFEKEMNYDKMAENYKESINYNPEMRRAYEKLGNYEFKINKNYLAAFGFFKPIHNFIQAKKSLDLLIEQEPTVWRNYELKGDYLTECGLDSAIEAYHEAQSLIDDVTIKKKIFEKISDAKTSILTNAQAFKTKKIINYRFYLIEEIEKK